MVGGGPSIFRGAIEKIREETVGFCTLQVLLLAWVGWDKTKALFPYQAGDPR